MENCKVEIYNTSNNTYSICFTEMIDNIETSSCCTVIIENGKVKEIIDNISKELVLKRNFISLIHSMTKNITKEDLLTAKAESFKNGASEILSQKSKLYYNSENDSLVKVILTEYKYKNSGAIGMDEFVIPVI